jgi:hypothetical protein
MTVVRTEKRQRSFIGKICKWTFIGFNVLMLVWVIGGMNNVSKIQTSSQAEQIGAGLGAAVGFGAIGIIWMFGAIILGIFVLLTRGNKVIIEERAGSLAGGAFQSYAAPDFSRADDRIQEALAARNQRPTTPAPATGGFGKRG